MSHFYTELFVHLVWACAHRTPFIEERLAARMHRRLAALCKREGCPAIAVGGIADHVHLLVEMHPAVALSTLVRVTKANTSQWMSAELPGSTFAWQTGYGAFSLRTHEVDTARAYILRQREHHAEGTIIPAWERSSPIPFLAESLAPEPAQRVIP